MRATEESLAGCPICKTPIIQKGGKGHPKRIYCSDVCKERAYRKRKTEEQIAAKRSADAEAKERIASLEQQVRELEYQLAAIQSVNERFRNDTQVRAFGSWLEKQARYYAQTPFGQRFLDGRKNRILPPRASRATYEQILYHRLGYSTEDIEMFREAWREMLKTQF